MATNQASQTTLSSNSKEFSGKGFRLVTIDKDKKLVGINGIYFYQNSEGIVLDQLPTDEDLKKLKETPLLKKNPFSPTHRNACRNWRLLLDSGKPIAVALRLVGEHVEKTPLRIIPPQSDLHHKRVPKNLSFLNEFFSITDTPLEGAVA